MAVTPTGAFPQLPNSGSATNTGLTTANTNYTTPSNTVTIFTAGANGSDVTNVGVAVYATNTAATVDIFKKNGSAYMFLGSALIPANTVSATAAKPTYAIPLFDGSYVSKNNPLYLVSGDTLVASTSVTQSTFQPFAIGRDY